MAISKATEKARKLKHIKIYDRLYQMIQDGIYPPGCQLPSEPDLAALMGVSRMTLRRALALLNEDGLVKNIRGKGNFVLNQASLPKVRQQGLETMTHPVYLCCTEHPDQLETEFRLEPPTDPITKSLGRTCAALVIADRWYKAHGLPLAYSLTFLPIEVVSQEKLDLNNLQELESFLESSCYQKAAGRVIQITPSTAGNFSAQKYVLAKNNAFILIQETLFDQEGQSLAVTKHYIPLELFQAFICS